VALGQLVETCKRPDVDECSLSAVMSEWLEPGETEERRLRDIEKSGGNRGQNRAFRQWHRAARK
jgi:hypothetical protein